MRKGGHFPVQLSLHDFLLFTIAGVVFTWTIGRYLTGPLKKLGEAASKIAEGKLETRVERSVSTRRDEIGELARNFDTMAERIETLVRGQRRLLADVSHELRSPLSRITVALGFAKQGSPEDIAASLERIGIESGRLDHLIGQLLTLARIDSGMDRSAPATVDLLALVQEIVEDGNFEAAAHGRSVRLVWADTCSISGHEDLLRSAIENVVRNAIKYTAQGTAVEVSLDASASNRVVAIRDHGPGVSESMLTEMFLPFRRSGERDNDGAGLGLAITERAVHVHGGTVVASNVRDGGLRVEIRLPG